MKIFNEVRNFDRIQFSDLRKIVDPPFNDVHDELSDCYYNEKPFRTYGILDKETFDKLHGLIFYLRDIALNEANEKQAERNQKVYDVYHIKRKKEVRTEIVKDKKYELNIVEEDKTPLEQIQAKINELKSEGLELEI